MGIPTPCSGSAGVSHMETLANKSEAAHGLGTILLPPGALAEGRAAALTHGTPSRGATAAPHTHGTPFGHLQSTLARGRGQAAEQDEGG